MHQREVLAVGAGSLTDTLHLIWAAVTVVIIVTAVAIGATALGQAFRIYSFMTIVVMVIFGALTGACANRLEEGSPTPWIGLWERISIAAYLIWVVALAVALLRKEKVSPTA